jgi:hypothetical protein
MVPAPEPPMRALPSPAPTPAAMPAPPLQADHAIGPAARQPQYHSEILKIEEFEDAPVHHRDPVPQLHHVLIEHERHGRVRPRQIEGDRAYLQLEGGQAPLQLEGAQRRSFGLEEAPREQEGAQKKV